MPFRVLFGIIVCVDYCWTVDVIVWLLVVAFDILCLWVIMVGCVLMRLPLFNSVVVCDLHLFSCYLF